MVLACETSFERQKPRFNFRVDQRSGFEVSGLKDMRQCQKSALLGQEDAIQLSHQDRYALMTWVTKIFGHKLWIYWLNLTKEERDVFENDPLNFNTLHSGTSGMDIFVEISRVP